MKKLFMFLFILFFITGCYEPSFTKNEKFIVYKVKEIKRWDSITEQSISVCKYYAKRRGYTIHYKSIIGEYKQFEIGDTIHLCK